MLDTRLVSTRVDVLSGNVILESDDPQMDLEGFARPFCFFKDYEVRLRRSTAWPEAECGPGTRLKVFKGEALVEAAGNGIANRATVKEGAPGIPVGRAPYGEVRREDR